MVVFCTDVFLPIRFVQALELSTNHQHPIEHDELTKSYDDVHFSWDRSSISVVVMVVLCTSSSVLFACVTMGSI